MNTTVVVMTVTPEMATEWLTVYTYEHQRPVSPLHAKFLAEEMRRGQFKQNTVIEFSRLNGSKWVTDGRHRLSAVIASGVPQEFIVVERQYDDEQDIALDYTRTDKGKRRTISDDYRTLMLDLELGLTYTQVNALGSAIAMVNNDFLGLRQSKLHTDDRLRMMREYAEPYQKYLEAIAGCRSDIWSRLNRAATLSVALVTFRYSSVTYGDGKIDEFWHGTALADGLRIGDARKLAHEHILLTGMVGGATGTMQKSMSTPAYSSRYLANCFNAYIEGRDIKFTKVFDTTKPIVINGSPFKGK